MNELVQTWWPVVTFAFGVFGTFLGLWVNSKVGKAIKEERVDEKIADAVQKLADKMEKGDAANSALFTMVNERVAKVEGACGTFTPAVDFHKALLQIGEMGGDMKAMRAEMVAMHGEQRNTQRSVDRINDFLLEGTKK